jgi:hypothetical protein
MKANAYRGDDAEEVSVAEGCVLSMSSLLIYNCRNSYRRIL